MNVKKGSDRVPTMIIAGQYIADKGYSCFPTNLYAWYFAFQIPTMELYVCNTLMAILIEY